MAEGWPNAPHRVLLSNFVRQWLAEEARGSENRPDEPVVAQAPMGEETFLIRRFAVYPPNTETTGDIESLALYAGQCAGLVTGIKPAAHIVEELVSGAQDLLSKRMADLAGRIPSATVSC